ncbi:hypothetical protein HZB78_05510 [Candidatus Collierbacteria bacterium]|nr:hypothetical protein [Candidatus Collierbacteria bacterium]
MKETAELVRKSTPLPELVRQSTTGETEIKKAVMARSALLDALYNLSFIPDVDPDMFDYLKSQLRPRRVWNFVTVFLVRIGRNVKNKKT